MAECLGLEKIEGAGLKSKLGKGESETLLTGYCDSELPGCCSKLSCDAGMLFNPGSTLKLFQSGRDTGRGSRKLWPTGVRGVRSPFLCSMVGVRTEDKCGVILILEMSLGVGE